MMFDLNQKLQKKLLRPAFNELLKKFFPGIHLAFDGKANVYSPIELDISVLNTPFKVEVNSEGFLKPKAFTIKMKPTLDPKIDMTCLRNYKNERIFDKPMRAIQCLDVVLRSGCADKSVVSGRSFYTKPNEKLDLGDNYELWMGLFQAAVLGDVPFLNIDVSHKAFPSEINIIEVIKSLRYSNLNQQLGNDQIRGLHSFLSGLIINYGLPNSLPKQYKYAKVMDPPNRLKFKLENGREMTIQQYFEEEKGYKLQYPNMPCIKIGNKEVYVPCELCTVPGGQVTNKKAGTNQVRSLIKYAATTTIERKVKIMNLFDYFQHNQNETIREFRLSLGNNFITISARIINAPSLEYADLKKIMPTNGSWNPPNNANYIQAARMNQWAVLICEQRDCSESSARAFADKIVDFGKRLNMNIADRYEVVKSQRGDFQTDIENLKKRNMDIVFVIMPKFGDSYSKIKRKAEIDCGLLTQCIKSLTVMNKGRDPSTVSNILLKVNSKLNGFNHKISNESETSILKDDIMFVGADVTHPSPDQRSIPSVVGVVASHDKCGFKYNIRWRLQDPNQEMISDMQNILSEHLSYYKSQNNKLPKKIIYYRDGVSDGQFVKLSNIELLAMDRACAKAEPHYKPAITCVVVQKRHHTRFFPKENSRLNERDRYRNVPPGTIVDSTITHPKENQFFMVSHQSIQGVAKPTKYCIIRDDSKFDTDKFQSLTYNMCHMFTRCNRTVSYPAPAYYAHLVAARGRAYIEGERLDLRNLQRENKRSEIKESIIKQHPMFFV